MSTRSAALERGVSLVEVVIFIVVVSLAVAGVLVAMDRTARNSADPLVIKQALAIAEALMDEVQLAPFTFCDPNDANVTTATSAAVGASGCAATVEAIGPEAGESRQTYDNVNDYHAPAFAAIQEIVRSLEADPKTDWSKVNIEGLRQHLIDMDNVTLRSSVASAPVESGVRFTVTACTSMRSSPGPGTGVGNSSSRITSGGPNSRMTIAFMRAVQFGL